MSHKGVEGGVQSAHSTLQMQVAAAYPVSTAGSLKGVTWMLAA